MYNLLMFTSIQVTRHRFPFRKLSLLAAISSVLIGALACDRVDERPSATDQHSATRTESLSREVSPRPGATEFNQLAQLLADPLMTSTDAPDQLAVSMDELTAAANVKILHYRELASAPVKIATLAAEAAEAQRALLDAHRALTTAGNGDLDALLLIIGLIAGNPGIAFSGLQGSFDVSAANSQLEREYASAFHRNRGAQLTLTALAGDYAGDPSASTLISIDVDESWHGLTTPYDRVAIRNNSGQTLHDCTIEITLTGTDGQRHRNVHFLPSWEANAVASAHYGIGVTIGNERLGMQTVYGIQTVTVTVWSREARIDRAHYQYAGKEREKDARAFLDNDLAFDYELVDAGLINYVPAVVMRLNGVAELPQHIVTLTFYRNQDQLSASWNQDRWRKGQIVQFQPNPRLPWKPDGATLAISFMDIDYVWRKKLVFTDN